ncbi:hypothetical protein JKP88DRAFT_273013 [Tribonema minus]|uniref:Uncharacterized protein n=1 Tax=Tribonema minus TaxID=303371 RepID=A0A835YYG6_9STRA|nr:hypothetical protein JKP88DRAFT_273013 [Tribonema minus]
MEDGSKRARTATLHFPGCAEAVFQYCRPEALAKWACTSADMRERVARRSSELLREAKLTGHQRRTLGNVMRATPLHVRLAERRLCAICGGAWTGGFHTRFGVPAHPRCVRSRIVNVCHLRKTRHVAHLLAYLPAARVTTYSSYFGRRESEAVWRSPHPCVRPEWTLDWYDVRYAHVNAAHADRKRLERERRAGVRRQRAEAAKRSKRRRLAREVRRRRLWREAFDELTGLAEPPPAYKSYLSFARAASAATSVAVRSMTPGNAVRAAELHARGSGRLDEAAWTVAARAFPEGDAELAAWQRRFDALTGAGLWGRCEAETAHLLGQALIRTVERVCERVRDGESGSGAHFVTLCAACRRRQGDEGCERRACAQCCTGDCAVHGP